MDLIATQVAFRCNHGKANCVTERGFAIRDQRADLADRRE